MKTTINNHQYEVNKNGNLPYSINSGESFDLEWSADIIKESDSISLKIIVPNQSFSINSELIDENSGSEKNVIAYYHITDIQIQDNILNITKDYVKPIFISLHIHINDISLKDHSISFNNVKAIISFE